MNEEKVLNELLKDKLVVNIVCKEKEIMIEFSEGYRFYIDSKSEIQLSIVEK